MRKHGWYYDNWTNSVELSTGETLHIEYSSKRLPATWNDPEEYEQSETQFYLDSVPYVRESLPSEVTDALIAQLEATASRCKEDSDPFFDGTDFDD